jgi:methylmalonyl-CoA mutase
MMESLTKEMADKGWAIIEEVQAQGGMTKAVDSGWAKLKIEASAAEKQARIDSGTDVIVGVNKYKLAKEDPIEIREVDNVKVRDGQIARLQALRASRYSVSGRGPFGEEFVTAGGVPLQELNLATMASRKQAGLYLVGELLDVDGVTGGFNFQHCWTSGWLAGRAIAAAVVMPVVS